MKKIILLLALIGCSLGTTSLFVSAEFTASLKMVPKNPEPRSTVTLTIESYSFNVNTAKITWKAGGKVLLEGQGATSVTVRTGAIGEATPVTVIALLADGTTVEQSVNLSPSSVTLLYEAPQSYVPPLYEGRSLPGAGAPVRVIAFPMMSDGRGALNPSSLSYAWYVNGSLLKSNSGLGKQVANLNLDYIKNKTDIRVLITTPQGNVAEKTITIYPHLVMPVLYNYDTILGTDYTQAVGKRYETVKDFTLSLEPYFVTSYPSTPAKFTWYLDGLPSTPLGGRILALQPKANSFGTKLLSIDVVGSDKLLQKANIRTELIFDTRK